MGFGHAKGLAWHLQWCDFFGWDDVENQGGVRTRELSSATAPTKLALSLSYGGVRDAGQHIIREGRTHRLEDPARTLYTLIMWWRGTKNGGGSGRRGSMRYKSNEMLHETSNLGRSSSAREIKQTDRCKVGLYSTVHYMRMGIGGAWIPGKDAWSSHKNVKHNDIHGYDRTQEGPQKNESDAGSRVVSGAEAVYCLSFALEGEALMLCRSLLYLTRYQLSLV